MSARVACDVCGRDLSFAFRIIDGPDLIAVDKRQDEFSQFSMRHPKFGQQSFDVCDDCRGRVARAIARIVQEVRP